MKIYEAHLKSLSSYSRTKHHETPWLTRESPEDYEKRTWKERFGWNGNGKGVMDAVQFKKMLDAAAAYRSEKIKGKGQKTWTKKFVAGIMVPNGIELNVTRETLPGQWVFVPSDGKTGGGKRVNKCFGVIQSWEGKVQFYILDDSITEGIFTDTLKDAGRFIGIGCNAPRVGGSYGRFEVVSVKEIAGDA